MSLSRLKKWKIKLVNSYPCLELDNKKLKEFYTSGTQKTEKRISKHAGQNDVRLGYAKFCIPLKTIMFYLHIFVQKLSLLSRTGWLNKWKLHTQQMAYGLV